VSSKTGTIRFGLYLGQGGTAAEIRQIIDIAVEADRLGFDSVWVAEAWGTDSVSVLSWIAAVTDRIGLGSAVFQIPARTPVSAASAAASIDLMSGGRFRLGLGPSGPQVAEGWHGQPWKGSLGRSREYVEIVRAVLRRETIEFHGRHYDIPYRGPGSTDLGIALRPIIHPLRSDLPIYFGSMGLRSIELAGEIADGWLPFLMVPERLDDRFRPALEAGFRRRPDPATSARFDVAPLVPLAIGQDLQACRDSLKPMLARYIGAMGSRSFNFYTDLVRNFGFTAAADQIQDLYMSGMREQAIAAVPDELVDAVGLVGPPNRIGVRLQAWEAAGVTTILAEPRNVEEVRSLAEIAFTAAR
jgi:F420-dependent oxidoreductase-like protein